MFDGARQAVGFLLRLRQCNERIFLVIDHIFRFQYFQRVGDGRHFHIESRRDVFDSCDFKLFL